MGLSATPLHPLFAAKITGVDLSRPIDEDLQHAIERAMDEHAVCILPDQCLEDKQQIAFSRLYGPLEVSPPVQAKSGTAQFNTRVQHREIFDVSNLDEKGAILDENDAARHTGWEINSGTPTARSGRNRPPGRCCTPA